MRKSIYVVFHRHGQRAPAKEITNDLDIWKSLIVTTGEVNSLQSRYPILQHCLNSEPYDKKTEPYGHLTTQGATYLESVGANIRNRFFLGGHTSISLSTVSTNYLRTQNSAQHLLNGLEIEGVVPVNVRLTRDCSLSFYDQNPSRASKLIALTQATPDFKQQEITMKKVVAEMTREFPLLQKANKGFDWLSAFDYFVCREAHGIPLLESMRPLSEAVKTYVSSRYGYYLRHKDHIALLAAPMLRDVLEAIKRSFSNHRTVTHDVTVYSCHDINLLGLLYALGSPLTSTEGLPQPQLNNYSQCMCILILSIVTSNPKTL